MNRLLPLLALFTATLLAACGGKVVVDAPVGGDGGAGGTGAGGTTITTSTSTVTTGPGDLCAQICTFWDQSGCTMSDCATECAAAFQTAGSCTDELITVLQCIIAHPDPAGGCGMPAACTAAFESYQSCIAPTSCTDTSCFQSSDGSCGCKGLCNGLTVAVECTNGLCTCNANGMQIGQCKEAAPSCDPVGGCCGALFFAQEG